jgi:hypothetical protein
MAGVIAAWVALNCGIAPDQWNDMVDRACERYLVEKAPPQSRSHPGHKFQTFEALKTDDPIAASELGGSVERILAASFGWSNRVSGEPE